MHWYHIIQHWLAYQTGSENTPGTPPNYNFFSGSGSDLAEVTLMGTIMAIFRRHNCHTRWCLRFGRHEFTDPATGLKYNLCRKHHPDHPGRRQLSSKRIEEISNGVG